MTNELQSVSFSAMPNELILRVYAHLDLQGLIASRCVSHKWRDLVPSTEMLPLRKNMLDFYDDLLKSPLFFKTRPWVLENLRPFNRQAYIAKLTRQHPSLPEEFRLWVLEWPERAVVGCSWPGLPRRRYASEYADNVNVMEGTNWLAYPQVSILTYQETANRRAEHIPAVVVRISRIGTIWLILDEMRSMTGKVFYARYSHSVVKSRELESPYDSLEGWIAYQKQIWKDAENTAEHHASQAVGRPWFKLENIPIDNSPSAFPEAIEISTSAWLRRNEPAIQERLRQLNDTIDPT